MIFTNWLFLLSILCTCISLAVVTEIVDSSNVSQQVDIASNEGPSTVMSAYESFISSKPLKKVKSGGLPLPGLLYMLLKFPAVVKEFYNRLPDKIKELPMALMNRARQRDPIVTWMRTD